MQQANPYQDVDINALKAQVDAEIASRLEAEADYARYIHRRGFQVGELRLLVGMAEASEVAKIPPLFRLPGAPAGIKGLANRHGRVVPVLDLLALFGNDEGTKDGGWLLVYGRGDEAVGIIIESLPDRKKFAQESSIPLEDIAHPIVFHLKAAYQENGQIWMEVDMGSLFASVFNLDAADM